MSPPRVQPAPLAAACLNLGNTYYCRPCMTKAVCLAPDLRTQGLALPQRAQQLFVVTRQMVREKEIERGGRACVRLLSLAAGTDPRH